MTNLFFDVIPAEIRQEIYGIRLSNALTRNYYRRVAQKVALTELVLKIKANCSRIIYHDIGYDRFNPNKNMVRYVMEKCSKVITNSDDSDWWISNLITPIQHGLTIYANLDENENYVRTEYAYNHLVNVLWM